MSSPEKYAEWIVANQDKKGSPEFETVVEAYKLSKETSAVTSPRLSFKKDLPGGGTPAERLAGDPVTRFALNAASPFFAAGRGLDQPRQFLGLPDWLEPELSKASRNVRPLVERGRAERGSTGFDVPAAMGEALNPMGLAVGGAVPYTKVFGATGEGLNAVGRNVASGGLMGLTTGGMSENLDPLMRFGIGAGANVTIPPVISSVLKGAGSTWDWMMGRLGPVKAGQIAREAAGSDIAAIRAATAAGSPTETATQATYGVRNDPWDAFGELAARNDPTSSQARMLAVQRQNQLDRARQVAGGATQTESRQAAEASKRSLGNIVDPMRRTELETANIAGRVGPGLQSEAERLGAAASGKVEDVRRFTQAGQVADDLAQSGRMRLDSGAPPAAGLPRVAGRYSYGAELSDLAERLAQGSADSSLALGQGARFKQMQLQSLAEHGLKPLDGGKIIRALNAKIADPKIGSETLKEKVLTIVRDRLSQWTNSGGVIDSYALHGIRKSAVNDAIEQLLGPADPKTKSIAAARILKEVKPLIDDEIVAAGGTGWRDFLKTYEEGMTLINQRRLGAKALDLLETSPKTFESLARGNEPRMVEKIFDSEYDIAIAMGEKANVLHSIADELARDRAISEGAARGGTALGRIINQDTVKFRLPALFTREATVTNKLIDLAEQSLSRRTMDALVEGMKTGRSARELLDTIPTSERIAFIKKLGPALVTGMSGGITEKSQR